MTERVMPINTIQEFLINALHSERLIVRQTNKTITIEPAEEDCTVYLRGILADYPMMSVDNFLERKHVDKELDR
jgi:hypothetical protein